MSVLYEFFVVNVTQAYTASRAVVTVENNISTANFIK